MDTIERNQWIDKIKKYRKLQDLTPDQIDEIIEYFQLLEEIKKYRTQKNLSQGKMAEIIGISQAAYAKIECGITQNITIDIGKGIAKALEISFNELFEIEVAENKGQEVELKAEIDRQKDLINGQKELITILKEQNEILNPFRFAFIQERTISELMVYATIERMKELAQKGEKIEITSFDVRQAAIAIYQKEYPDIELNPYLFISPSEMKKKQ